MRFGRLMELTFFRAHVAERREFNEQHLQLATVELAAADRREELERPPEFVSTEVRIGDVVQVDGSKYMQVTVSSTGGFAGIMAFGTSGDVPTGKIIGVVTNIPLKTKCTVTTLDRTKTYQDLSLERFGAILSCGLNEKEYNNRFGEAAEERMRKKLIEVIQTLPDEHQHALEAIRVRIEADRLPLISLLESHPLKFQSSHLSFQEFYCAKAICKGISFPPSVPNPWRWPPWWANMLVLGSQMEGFANGLLRSANLKPRLDLGGNPNFRPGHILYTSPEQKLPKRDAKERATSILAVAELLKAMTSVKCAQLLGPSSKTTHR